MNKAIINLSNCPVIAGVQITTDDQGRYNLNALHKASGLGEEKAPAKWSRSKQASELLQEMEKQTGQICLVSLEGRKGGTFAHELLAISYAGWISPKFQLMVNQVFLDYKKGELNDKFYIPQTLPDALRLAADLADENVHLTHKVEELEPKAEFHDKVVATHDSISLSEAAKTIGTGRNRLCMLMRKHKWLRRNNEPYQDKIERGLLDVKLSNWEHPDKGLQQAVTTLVTGKGLTALSQMLSNNA